MHYLVKVHAARLGIYFAVETLNPAPKTKKGSERRLFKETGTQPSLEGAS